VNKSGGPDKRFKDNRQRPICLYEEIRLRITSGLDEAFQLLRQQVGEKVRQGIHAQVATSATT
jgi:hypothetical protein